MKFKITPSESIGQNLRSEIVNLLNGINVDLNEGLKNIAQQGEAKAKDWAASRLSSTRQQYESALNAVQLGPNKWAIVLDASAAHLEEGYPSFDMKPGMLNSKAMVSTGSRAGQPWVRTSKEGYRYAYVPMDQSGTGKGAGRQNPDSQVQIQNPISKNSSGNLQRDMGPGARGLQSRGDLKNSLNIMINRGGLKGITKDGSGNPILGKVATMRSTTSGNMRVDMFNNGSKSNSRDVNLGTAMGGTQNEVDPLLNGAVKYQYEQKTKNGKTQVKSAYMTFRIVSENPNAKGQWKHPGFIGARIFPDLENWAEQALSKMVEELFQTTG